MNMTDLTELAEVIKAKANATRDSMGPNWLEVAKAVNEWYRSYREPQTATGNPPYKGNKTK